MSGFWNHERYCRDALTIEPAVTTGCLYHLPYGFPAMFDAPDGQVFGEVMTFSNLKETLKRLDYLEGYRPSGSSHYERIVKHVKLLTEDSKPMCKIDAWVYVFPSTRLPFMASTAEYIPNGNWRTFIEKRIL